MTTAGLIETIKNLASAYENTDYFKVPKIITATLSKRDISAVSCGVEIAIDSINQIVKGEFETTDPEIMANAILLTALEAFVIGEMS